uniref:Putative secreted protein n=1 Tax=Anopheles darlingi TaxID=43151 RepID=A0A2M4D4W5_ANODA
MLFSRPVGMLVCLTTVDLNALDCTTPPSHDRHNVHYRPSSNERGYAPFRGICSFTMHKENTNSQVR